MKHYSLKNILQQNALYNVIFGERSNGKTFAVLHLALFGYHKDGIDINGYLDDGTQLGIIRRWDTDFKGMKGQQMFDNFINNEEKGNIIESETRGKYKTKLPLHLLSLLLRKSITNRHPIRISN